MRCKTCDYPLWNLTSGICPECGESFLPGEFEFVPNSVQFCCPHCDQPYYGTDEHGHLDPREFECVKCGRLIDMEQMVLRPAEGLRDEQTIRQANPWLERKHRGFWRGWLATVGMALINPFRLLRATPPASGTGQAWWFAVVTIVLASLVYMVPWVCFMGIGFWGLGGGGGVGMGAALFSLVVLVGIVLNLVFIAAWGAATHGLLILTGGINASIGRTYQAICYSSGAYVTVAVPCLGTYFSWIWWLVSAVLATKEACQVSGGRAALSVLPLPVGLLAVGIGLYIWMIVAMSAIPQYTPAPVPLTTRSTIAQSATDEVLAYAALNNGAGPTHAIELLADYNLGPEEFVAGSGQSAIPLAGGRTLADWWGMSIDRRENARQILVESVSDDVIAHRLGDLVFTYHGIDLNNADPRLWIVILCDNPDTGIFSDPVWVGHADGSTVAIPVTGFDTALAKQNEVRATNGLPPLPDPRTISQRSHATMEH